MAIAEIKKIRFLALKSEENIIMSALQKTNIAEIKETVGFDDLFKGIKNNKDDLAEKTSRLTFAINLVEESEKELLKYLKEKPSEKKPFFSVRNNVSFHDFNLITAREYEINSYVEAIEKYYDKLTSLKSENSKQNNLIEQLKVFSGIDITLSTFADTKHTSIMLGTLPSESIAAFNELTEKEKSIVTQVYDGNTVCASVVICDLSESERLLSELTSIGFTRISFAYNKTAAQVIKDCQKSLAQILNERIVILKEIINYKQNISEIKLLYDYYNLAAIKKEYEDNFKCSAYTFVLECFVPAESVEDVKNSVYSKTKHVVIEVLDTKEDDAPPTLTKNKGLIAPFEAVTNMYSVPSPYERDPNFFVAIFFFIFFGIMLSDAGYGIILALGAFLLLRKAKMEDGLRKIVKIIALGGISTFIWGVLFGGWFGIDLQSAGDNPVAKFLLSLQWFSPMEEPLMMLGLCLGLGVVQILFSLGLKASALISKGKILDALMDVGSWYLLFAGIGMLGLSMIPEFAVLSDIGKYLLIASVAILILTQGRESKGIIKKLFKGIASLYGIVGYLSDVLSYARLFGLGLATGVVGLVMNTIAGMLFGSWLSFPLGLVVLLAGHTFNIGINVLGAYIHDCRLQYIEFFSRFYKGGGHVFKPYGSGLKYYKITN